MLPSIHRLTKKKDFETLFKEGKTIKDGFLFCKAAANNLNQSRFGFVVSKKVSTKAVERNKVRRRLRKAVIDALPAFGNSRPLDMAMVALPGLEKKTYVEVTGMVMAILKRAKQV